MAGRRSPGSGDPVYAVSEFRAAPTTRRPADQPPSQHAQPGSQPSVAEHAGLDGAPQRSGRERWRQEWGRGAGWRELALGLAIFALYLVVTHHAQVSHAAADSHGHWLMRFEGRLGVDVEHPLNRWLAGRDLLGALAAWEYATTYILTTFGFLGWLWWRRRDHYRWARGVLVATTLIAIACFALWPLTPPRLLPGAGFADVVAAHRPFLSWGSNTVSAGANQWAAMPSLHEGWAVWVTVVTIRGGAGRIGRTLAALHLVVTSYVIVATGNHFVLDIGAGIALVGVALLAYPAFTFATGLATGVALRLVRGRGAPPRGQRRTARQAGAMTGGWSLQPAPVVTVPAADAFFLHVESDDVPQIVGGVAILDTARLHTARLDTAAAEASGSERLRLAQVRALVAERLAGIPQFRRRLAPASSWRRPAWAEAEDIDLRYHVRATRVADGAGRRGLEELVGRLSSRQLDMRRPPWRLWFVHGVGPREAAVVVLVHHAVGDGIAVVSLLRHFLEPQAAPQLPPPPAQPGRLVRAAATAIGAVQLALDGRAQRTPFAGTVSQARTWRTIDAAFDRISGLAKASGARVTDVLLSVLGDVLSAVLRERGLDRAGRVLRVAVPITLRQPDSSGPPGSPRAPGPPGSPQPAGNATAALRIDVPLDDMSPHERLRAVRACAERRRRPGRVLATTAVIRAIGVLPPPLHRRAAKAMYQSRFFAAILTNMPGPAYEMSFAQLPLKDVYPVVPLAEGVPLAAGTLGWNGRLCLSVTAEPLLLPEADDIDVRLEAAFDRLAADLQRQDSAELAADSPGGDENAHSLQSQGSGAWPPSSG